jgi:transposase InsO family protein
MPVQRFRTHDAARRALWCDREDPSLHRRIARLWAAAGRLVAPRIPRGLRKFRSIEDANQDRERWVAARILSLQASRDRRP